MILKTEITYDKQLHSYFIFNRTQKISKQQYNLLKIDSKAYSVFITVKYLQAEGSLKSRIIHIIVELLFLTSCLNYFYLIVTMHMSILFGHVYLSVPISIIFKICIFQRFNLYFTLPMLIR
jgi:hypothetical protein